MGKTSVKSVQKYQKRVYDQVKVSLKKELVEQFKSKLASDNLTQAEFIRRAITAYLGEQY